MKCALCPIIQSYYLSNFFKKLLLFLNAPYTFLRKRSPIIHHVTMRLVLFLLKAEFVFVCGLLKHFCASEHFSINLTPFSASVVNAHLAQNINALKPKNAQVSPRCPYRRHGRPKLTAEIDSPPQITLIYHNLAIWDVSDVSYWAFSRLAIFGQNPKFLPDVHIGDMVGLSWLQKSTPRPR